MMVETFKEPNTMLLEQTQPAVRHPNEERLVKFYELFGQGKFPDALAMCADDIMFTVPGDTSFSGLHTKATFGGWIEKVWTLSGGTFRETPYRIIANDHHGVVLLDHYLTRNGQAIHYRVNHIYEIRDGVFSGWEEWPGDLEGFNAIWG
jgi:ketosteroid isomerase-like protein